MEPWRDLSRPEALALFWQWSRAIARQIVELRALQRWIGQTWGRAPRLPRWPGMREED
jgi:hypothetical protein